MTVSSDHGAGSSPHRLFGFNLKTTQMVLASLVALFGIFGSAITSGAWVGNVVLDREWDDRMAAFHEKAVPEIHDLIISEVRTAVAEHEAEALARYNADRLVLSSRLTSIEVHAEGTDQRLERIENMVWALYQSRFGNATPPTSPGSTR